MKNEKNEKMKIIKDERHPRGSRALTGRVVRKDHFGENEKNENNKK